ncbi:MAG: phage terminase small subunit-related protein [Thermodesulfobacteriota bacterium]
MKKNEDRKVAERLFLQDRGRISNKELAHKLQVHPATVARWKKIDEWEVKLVQAVSEPGPAPEPETGVYEKELRHLALLNEKIDAYLERKDLLPSEIRDLAEAKYKIINCLEIIQDRITYEHMDEFPDDEEFE